MPRFDPPMPMMTRCSGLGSFLARASADVS